MSLDAPISRMAFRWTAGSTPKVCETVSVVIAVLGGGGGGGSGGGGGGRGWGLLLVYAD